MTDKTKTKKEASEEVKETAKETTKETTKETPKETTKETPKETPKETQEAVETSTPETPEAEVLKEVPKEEDVEEELKASQRLSEAKDAWFPKTEIGKQIKTGQINDIDTILDDGGKILEPEIVDFLLPGVETDLLLIGQSKGKFGGGQRRVFRQTQKKTREGNKPQFATIAVVGDKNGHIGIGYGKSRETVPAREKSIRKAKLNIFKIRRGSGSWESDAAEPNSIPFKVTGKCGSSQITLIPAPKGTGLCVEKECAKILELAGIQDVWSKTSGQTKTKINLIKACEDALKQLANVKLLPEHYEKLSILEGNKGVSNE